MELLNSLSLFLVFFIRDNIFFVVLVSWIGYFVFISESMLFEVGCENWVFWVVFKVCVKVSIFLNKGFFKFFFLFDEGINGSRIVFNI